MVELRRRGGQGDRAGSHRCQDSWACKGAEWPPGSDEEFDRVLNDEGNGPTKGETIEDRSVPLSPPGDSRRRLGEGPYVQTSGMPRASSKSLRAMHDSNITLNAKRQ